MEISRFLLYGKFSVIEQEATTPGGPTGPGGYGSGSGYGATGGGSASSVSCSQTFTLGKGEFTSPSYPFNYPNNAYCRFLIEQPEGTTITLEFKDMGIENARVKDDNGVARCYYDYVEVRKARCSKMESGIIEPK